MFEATPYRHRAYAQAFFTTNGYQYHSLDYDAPYLAGLPLRLRANLAYEKNIAANYFGLGSRSLGRLSFPGSPERFASQSEYTDALRHVQPDGTAFTRFNQYILERPRAIIPSFSIILISKRASAGSPSRLLSVLRLKLTLMFILS